VATLPRVLVVGRSPMMALAGFRLSADSEDGADRAACSAGCLARVAPPVRPAFTDHYRIACTAEIELVISLQASTKSKLFTTLEDRYVVEPNFGEQGQWVSSNESESESVERLRRGELDALEPLVQRYYAQVLGVSRNICGSSEMAEDAVADAFLAVCRHIDQFDSARPFGPWLYRIVTNAALKAVRNARRSGISGGRILDQADPRPLPEAEVIRREEQGVLSKALDRLPPKQRAVVVLRYYLDMDEQTVADTLQVPIGTVKWRLHTARKQLRWALRDQGGVNRRIPSKETEAI